MPYDRLQPTLSATRPWIEPEMTPLALYRDLCLSAADPKGFASFWAGLFHLRQERSPRGVIRLHGDCRHETLWILPSDPASTLGYRLHFDLHAAEVSTLVELGAVVEDDTTFPWTVVRGPEGLELCVFPRPPGASGRDLELVAEASDPGATATWWAELLGATYDVASDGDYALVDPVPYAPFTTLMFTRSDTPRPETQRVHLQLTTENLDDVLGHGATLVARRDDPAVDASHRYLLKDPDGTEFYAVVDRY